MSDVYGKAEGHSKGFLWGPAGWTEIEMGTSGEMRGHVGRIVRETGRHVGR